MTRAARTTGTVLALLFWAGQAQAVQWVRYSFSGTGSAALLGRANPAVPPSQAVTFAGQVTVDLDAHAFASAPGEYWASSGSSAFSAASFSDMTSVAASSAAGSLRLSAAPMGSASGFQNWTLGALLPSGLNGDGRFPVFAGVLPVAGTVAFDVGNHLAEWKGTGQLATLSAERVSGPAAWAFSVGAARAVGPVPEPATWGLMLVGFGAVGLALRHRYRRRPAALG